MKLDDEFVKKQVIRLFWTSENTVLTSKGRQFKTLSRKLQQASTSSVSFALWSKNYWQNGQIYLNKEPRDSFRLNDGSSVNELTSDVRTITDFNIS